VKKSYNNFRQSLPHNAGKRGLGYLRGGKAEKMGCFRKYEKLAK